MKGTSSRSRDDHEPSPPGAKIPLRPGHAEREPRTRERSGAQRLFLGSSQEGEAVSALP